MTKRAVIYARVSTREQADGGVSLAAQEAALAAFCQGRGLEVVRTAVDRGVSASVPLAKRPEGAELVRLVEERLVDVVVAPRLDRLFRRASEALTVTEAWQQRGLGLHLLDLGVDVGTTAGRMVLGILASAAEMERSLLRDRIRDALAHLRAQGYSTGPPPLGYAYAPERDAQGRRSLVEVEDELLTVALVREFVDEQGETFSEVARRLNAAGIPTKRGGRWHHGTVAKIMRR
ncbi:MAG: recombinase family protein [Deltaproteobacteria bacterium]|nr:recombinase family protein [Deltaproteobacteria bacterium]